jgi:hypothetical protein
MEMKDNQEKKDEVLIESTNVTKFILLSAAIWIFSIALSISLGFLMGFQYSWVALLIAAGGQVLAQSILLPKNKNGKPN